MAAFIIIIVIKIVIDCTILSFSFSRILLHPPRGYDDDDDGSLGEGFFTIDWTSSSSSSLFSSFSTDTNVWNNVHSLFMIPAASSIPVCATVMSDLRELLFLDLLPGVGRLGFHRRLQESSVFVHRSRGKIDGTTDVTGWQPDLAIYSLSRCSIQYLHHQKCRLIEGQVTKPLSLGWMSGNQSRTIIVVLLLVVLLPIFRVQLFPRIASSTPAV